MIDHFKLLQLNSEIEACTRCARLIRHCQEVAQTRRRAFREWDYWGKPVPSFGDPAARLLIIGLAPGTHGSNRTGRMFTGDQSGVFLYRALYRAGFASQPGSSHKGDGLELRDVWITAAGHCAPPDNKPLPGELLNCRPFLERELALLSNLRLVLVLGKVACDAYLRILADAGRVGRVGQYRFGHNILHGLDPPLLCSYHPSQQNTSTGKLTEAMFDEVFARARQIIESGPARAVPHRL